MREFNPMQNEGNVRIAYVRYVRILFHIVSCTNNSNRSYLHTNGVTNNVPQTILGTMQLTVLEEKRANTSAESSVAATRPATSRLM